MRGRFKRHRLISTLLLVAVVAATQTFALVHASDHDPGSARTLSCSICITAQAGSAAAIDNAWQSAPRIARHLLNSADQAPVVPPRHRSIPQPRAPPRHT